MPTLLLVRPRAQSAALIGVLSARGIEPPTVVSPVVEIVTRPVAIPADVDLVLTSQNAVGALPPGRWRAWCVGDRTAQAAAAAGLDAVSAGGDACALAALLTARAPGRRLLHVRGAHVAGDLVSRLRAGGHATDEVVAYDQVARPLSAEAAGLLAREGVVVLPLYSPRSARLVDGHAGPWRAEVRAVAISEAAAAAFSRGAAPTVAAAPTGAAMEEAIAAALGG